MPTSEELAMQCADHIFIEGLWQEVELPKTELKLNCNDSSSHLSHNTNEGKLEKMTPDDVST